MEKERLRLPSHIKNNIFTMLYNCTFLKKNKQNKNWNPLNWKRKTNDIRNIFLKTQKFFSSCELKCFLLLDSNKDFSVLIKRKFVPIIMDDRVTLSSSVSASYRQVWEKLTPCGAFPCRPKCNNCYHNLQWTRAYFFKRKTKKDTDYINGWRNVRMISFKKILPYNVHGTMAYYTPLYTPYICSEPFQTV